LKFILQASGRDSLPSFFQMTAFLEEWIGRGGWTIYRLSDMALGNELKYNFVAWVAWKSVE
jgi:hypothetical protein